MTDINELITKLLYKNNLTFEESYDLMNNISYWSSTTLDITLPTYD